MNTKDIILSLKEPLKEMIQPDFLLTDDLLKQKVLTDQERQIVKSKESLQQRNESLLNFVLQKDELAQLRFMGALRDDDQRHVCNFIQCNGGKQFDTNHYLSVIETVLTLNPVGLLLTVSWANGRHLWTFPLITTAFVYLYLNLVYADWQEVEAIYGDNRPLNDACLLYTSPSPRD